MYTPVALGGRAADARWFTSLPDSGAALASILGSVPDVVAVHDLDGRYVLVNQVAADVLGRPGNEILGLTHEDVLPPGVAKVLTAHARSVIRSGEPVRFEAAVPHAIHGETREYLVTMGVWRHVPDGPVGGIVVHATELRRSEALYSGIVALASDAIITIDGRQRILLFNRGAEVVFGYTAAEVLGRPLDVLLPDETREHHRQVHVPDFIREGEREGIVHSRAEVRGRRKNGEVFPAEIAISRVNTGGVARYAAILRDVTEQRRRDQVLERQRLELARSNAELARSNAELEQFAYVASHDLQEPLRAVASHTQLLEERYGAALDDRALKHIHYAVEGARRMQALIEDLLSLSRVGTRGRPFVPVDLNLVLAGTIRSLTPAASEAGGTIRATTLPTVLGDPAQLDEVFTNLVGNALKFHRPGVAPLVQISVQERADDWLFGIEDNGIGIDPAFAERIFEVFRRLHTREEYPGTGIGLSICRKVVERHGGRIWVEPATDGGSLFRFTLPRTAGAAGREVAT